MTKIYEVVPDDIEGLTDIQLTDLLLRLLHLEATSFNIPSSSVAGSLRVNVGDGGEDCSIKWVGNPEHTNWIPRRYTVFQCKATYMPPSECGKEICRNSSQLKPQVENVLDAGGSYILFYHKPCTATMMQDRMAEFKGAIRNVGKPYADTANIHIYDANKIASWVNQYLPAIIFVLNSIGRSIPMGLQTWDQWKNHPDNQLMYISDGELESHIQQLKQHFTEPKKVARIVGLSGLGKTRLAFEAFRPPENPEISIEQQLLFNQVVYINAANINVLPGIVASWRVQKLSGLLIVDNCDLVTHQLLQNEVRYTDSNLSLLTLDFTPELSSSDCPYIKLEQVSNEVIKGIIKKSYPGFHDCDVERIADFAQGFPKMAVLLAKARLNEEPDIGRIRDDLIIGKLLWGRGQEDPTAHNVISACALFEHLGFSEDVVEQRYFIANKICNVDNDKFYSVAQDFIKRGILDKRHRFVRVVPRPLAIRLAADWWQKCSPEKAKMLLQEAMPTGLAEALCDQMSKLQFLPEAQAFVRDLCGDQAPFGQAEVLNSEKGSRLFRSLVEVNPHVTVNVLEKVFGGWTREQFLEIVPGRRNLVWSLEKLCFWEDTFLKAARVMLALGAAENETWGNNATNQFLQLFHVFLSGTQAHPKLRICVIDEALVSGDINIKTLAVKALGHALKNCHFSRSCGVEVQGSRAPQEDWKPKLWSEVFDYWRESLTRLTHIACEDNEISIIARDQIVKSIRGLVQAGLMDEIDKSLTEIIAIKGSFWPEALNMLQESVQYDGPRIPEDGLERLNKWIDIMKPQSISERLILLVSNPKWDHVKDDSGRYIDLAEKDVTDFAKECADDITSLLQSLEIVFTGDQRKGYAFGYSLGESLSVPDRFIKSALTTLAHIPPDRANPTVLGGFLAAIKPNYCSLVVETMDSIANDEILYIYTVDLTRLINPGQNDLKRVLGLMDSGKISANELRAFAYGGVLKHESSEVVISFCNEIIRYDLGALSTVFEILYMYSWDKPDKFNACSEELRKILLNPGMIANNLMLDRIGYGLQETIISFLDAENGDIELAHHVSNEIINICSQKDFSYGLEHYITPVISKLLSRYPYFSWSIFSKGFFSDNCFLSFNLLNLFEPHFELESETYGVLFELSEEFLIEWCKEHSEKAPYVLTKLIPLLINVDGSWSIHSIAQFLFDTYGDNSDVVMQIFRSLGPRSWIGSVIPYYEQQIEAIEKLVEHRIPNVRKLTRERIEYLKQSIEREKLREEEEELGIY